MLRKPTLFPRLLLLTLLVFLGSAGFAVDLSAHPALVPAAQGIPDTFTQVGENDTFQLYADPATLAFKVVDKRSGYVWHSNLDEVLEEDDLNRTWTAFATSGISIDYFDSETDDERASITSAEHTIDFQPLEQGFHADLTFVEPSITLGITVQLEDDGVRVEVPYASIREADPEFRLGLLHLYPFVGATRADEVPGYMFIPDGAGTVIQFAAQTRARNMFLGRYYGNDLGVIGQPPFNRFETPAQRLSIPVIGMVHGENENAFVAIVEKGASYGELRAHPAGVTTKFNFVYNGFIYNQSYFQATNRSGAGVTVLQPATNPFDVVVHYRFLTGDDGDYVGMARSYQEYLVSKGLLSQRLDATPDVGIRLEFLGAEKEKILFWERTIPVTTIAQIGEILRNLTLRNPEVVYYGWQPRGADSMYPTSLSLDGALGTTAQLRSFAEEVAAAHGRVSLYVDPQAALQGTGGYSERSDIALAITDVNVEGWNRWKGNYYLNINALRGRFLPLAGAVSRETGIGLALDGLGYTLYSDHASDDVMTREETIPLYQQLVDQSGVESAFYRPNDYMFPYMRAYYDMPVTDSGYLYTTEVVPFLEVALAGYVPMYGPVLNFSPHLRADLLRHADFGVYPSFILTHAPTTTILNTSSGWIFSSWYEQWEEEVEESYQWLNELLAPVKGQQVTARELIGPGVYATTYSNGRQIVVNYNRSPFTSGDIFVEPENAIVREVDP